MSLQQFKEKFTILFYFLHLNKRVMTGRKIEFLYSIYKLGSLFQGSNTVLARFHPQTFIEPFEPGIKLYFTKKSDHFEGNIGEILFYGGF